MLMRFPDPVGWMYAAPEEVEALIKKGWVKSSEKERQDFIAAKHQRAKEAAQAQTNAKR